jgi:MoxR-like ATPase
MPVPDFQSIMLPLLKITTDGQEHKQGEIKDKLALQFQLNDIDQEEKLPGGGLRFDNNVAWSVVYLRKAGLLENSKRGIFHITEQGREILKNNPTKIDIKYLKQYPSFREWQEASIKTNDPSKNGKVVVNPDEENPIYSDPSEIDPKNTPSYWIFQANPKYYDLAGAAKELKEISWKINRYKEYIHVGDIVYFWEAGNEAGIVAIGKIDSIHAAITTPNEEMKFVRGDENRDEGPTPFYGARVSIEPVRFDRIEKQTLLNNPVFGSMHILRQPQGTNFKVTYEEAQALNDLIGVNIEPDTPDRFYEDTGIDKESLDRWVKTIKRKGQVIFYGPPGTGKTYLAERLAKYLISEGDGFKDIVQFHPAYAYEDFIQGIRPQPREDGTLNYPIVRGRFLEFCDRAKSHQGICVLIIDEINRANLARVFGELMYLLEYRDREMNLSGGGTLKIPSNVLIIGTMNTADRSIALVDHALRRRFAFLSLSPDYNILRQYHQKKAINFPVEALISELTRLNNQLDRHYQVGISFFLRDNLKDEIEDIWKMEILPYLEEYFFDQPEKLDDFGWETIKGKIGL